MNDTIKNTRQDTQQDTRYKRPESVLIVIYARDKNNKKVLLLRRKMPDYFWQSVTGALDWGEEPYAAAVRELHEETGLSAEGIVDCKTSYPFVIYPIWRHRYAPGIVENVEHVFCLEVASPCDITLDGAEHSEYGWFDYDEAVKRVSSHTNSEAIRKWVAHDRTNLHA